MTTKKTNIMENNLTQLYQLMAEGVCPSDLTGTCKVMTDNGEIFITLEKDELTSSDAFSGQPDVVVKMASQTLSMIITNLDKFDLRDPNVLMHVTVQGNIELAVFLFSSIKRPSARIQNLINETVAKAQGYREQISEVKRIHKPTEEEVVFMMDKSVPFVITGMLDNWEFISSSLEDIKQKYGDVKLRPVVEEGKEKFQTMKDFIEMVESEEDAQYTGGCGMPPAMWSKFKMPYFDSSSFSAPQLWMGSRSGEKPCTALHRDCCHGMLANIMGRKKMILFSPDQTDHMYPHKAFNTYQTCEITDVQAVDVDRYPDFANAKPVEVTVGPGELLVIPAFWYHCVYAVDNVFSVSSGLTWDAWDNLRPKESVSLTL